MLWAQGARYLLLCMPQPDTSCVSVFSKDVFICLCLGVPELLSLCSQACLPGHKSAVCLGVLCTLNWRGPCVCDLHLNSQLKLCGMMTWGSLFCAWVVLCVYIVSLTELRVWCVWCV